MSLLYAVCTAGICHFRCIFQTAELLPLLVGLIGVYNFYQVVLTLTGQTELFGRLKDMLLIQVLSDSYLYHGFSENPYPLRGAVDYVLCAARAECDCFYALPAAGNLSHLFQNLLNRMYGGDRCRWGPHAYSAFPTMHEHQIANLSILCSMNAAAMCGKSFLLFRAIF